jgi:hypothetical protein
MGSSNCKDIMNFGRGKENQVHILATSEKAERQNLSGAGESQNVGMIYTRAKKGRNGPTGVSMITKRIIWNRSQIFAEAHFRNELTKWIRDYARLE